MKFDMRIKNINNMQSNSQVFKICSYVNFFSENYSYLLDTIELQSKIGPKRIALYYSWHNVCISKCFICFLEVFYNAHLEFFL